MLGIFICASVPVLINLILQKYMVLAPDSMSYPMWKDLPVPLTASMYLFNVTNPDEVKNFGAKPKLQEVKLFHF